MSNKNPLVCRFGSMGDMVMITPLLKHLYQRSGLKCDIISKGAWNKVLFENMPYVRHIYSVDSSSSPYWLNSSQRQLITRLKAQQYQNVWVCENNEKPFQLLTRAGINKKNCIHEFQFPSLPDQHYSDRWLHMANQSPAGFNFKQLDIPPLNVELFVSQQEVDECKTWLNTRSLDSAKPIICIQAGNNRTARRRLGTKTVNTKFWPAKNWAETIDGLFESLDDAQVLLCGVPNELSLCEDIIKLCRPNKHLQTVADDLPLRRLFTLLSIAHSCISVDTGPAHVAAAVNCPLTVLFGGQYSPEVFRPVSTDSPVSVLQGKVILDGAETSDISAIGVAQVMSSWSSL